MDPVRRVEATRAVSRTRSENGVLAHGVILGGEEHVELLRGTNDAGVRSPTEGVSARVHGATNPRTIRDSGQVDGAIRAGSRAQRAESVVR